MEEHYKEIVTTMGELQPGDLVLGIDGEWHEMELLPVHVPERMFRIDFENGSVECSGDHEWTFYSDDFGFDIQSTALIFEKRIYNCNYGKKDGPKILRIKEIDPKPSRCISTNAPGNLFEIETDTGEHVFTHNCQMRLVCGRLGSVASLMALGNTLATTISGSQLGAGAIASNGMIDMVQYYYAEHQWLMDWYKARGLDRFGFDPGRKEEDVVTERLEGEELLEIESEKIEIDFAGVHSEIDKSQDQRFEEI